MATEEQLRRSIRQAALEGRAACKVLLDLAARTGTSPAQIGQLCNQMGVKIAHCQLGCFQ